MKEQQMFVRVLTPNDRDEFDTKVQYTLFLYPWLQRIRCRPVLSFSIHLD